jgi:hypothetical protein
MQNVAGEYSRPSSNNTVDDLCLVVITKMPIGVIASRRNTSARQLCSFRKTSWLPAKRDQMVSAGRPERVNGKWETNSASRANFRVLITHCQKIRGSVHDVK